MCVIAKSSRLQQVKNLNLLSCMKPKYYERIMNTDILNSLTSHNYSFVQDNALVYKMCLN